jgi:hypothetical protein
VVVDDLALGIGPGTGGALPDRRGARRWASLCGNVEEVASVLGEQFGGVGGGDETLASPLPVACQIASHGV